MQQPQQPQQPAKTLRWREEAEARIAYLAQQEKQALIDIDALPVGSHIRAAHWAYIKELGYRKNELQDLLNKFPAEDLSAPASPVEEKGKEVSMWDLINEKRAIEIELFNTKKELSELRKQLTESKPSPVIAENKKDA